MANQPLSLNQMMDTFAFMVMEEFLMKKDMPVTLQKFREEWDRPPEVIT